jgi:hypothetical protein
MAEDTLVKELLTDQLIAAGAELTRKLERSTWPVVASLWLYDSEINEWRLVIASPRVGSDGPLAAYREVSAALQAGGESVLPLSLEDISVVSAEDSRVRALAFAYPSGVDIEGHRIFRGAINGHYIDDAYIYRLPPVAPAA